MCTRGCARVLGVCVCVVVGGGGGARREDTLFTDGFNA